ncbi:MAG: hypothetical protein CVU28_13510 [Betaproteobacteria bacterium HGW-Betaproteobacteria-21]|nr:MAG: hypothetical protein CVU28_13510 [Betaproteobacteria bacterium HGW-Betaproteobacteria-21]
MEMIKQILTAFRSGLPNDSKTAAAIDRGAGTEEIANCANEEQLHALAGALFEALEEQDHASGEDSDCRVTSQLASRLREFRSQMPAESATAQAIDRGATIEEISEAAQEEGLSSLTAMLFEAEQEAARTKG